AEYARHGSRELDLEDALRRAHVRACRAVRHAQQDVRSIRWMNARSDDLGKGVLWSVAVGRCRAATLSQVPLAEPSAENASVAPDATQCRRPSHRGLLR